MQYTKIYVFKMERHPSFNGFIKIFGVKNFVQFKSFSLLNLMSVS